MKIAARHEFQPLSRGERMLYGMKKIFMLLLVLSLCAVSLYGGSARASGEGRVLVAYFSLWGNSEYPEGADATSSASLLETGGARMGTTEYAARVVGELTGGELYAIRTTDKYPADFDAVIEANHDEIDRGYLPPLSGALPDMSEYDAVFIGYPVWANTAPRAVISFIKECGGLAGKTVVPFCTHDGYGSGRSYAEIFAAAPDAGRREGIDIDARGVPDARGRVPEWLRSIDMARKAEAAETRKIKITVAGRSLDGVLFDTPLAREIAARMPLTVSMVGYGGREYYGGLDFTPQTEAGGRLRFDDGDITYCPTNNTLAIFYAQTDRPNLTMEVIPIGRVTSDLKIFDTLGGREDFTFAAAE